MIQRTARLCLSWLLPLSLLFAPSLPGCGGKDTITSPDDPFAALVAGDDETLDIVTWNLENFAKRDQVTIDYLVQAIEAMDVDIIALQEIQEAVNFRRLYTSLEGWSGRRATDVGTNMELAYLYRDDGRLGTVQIREILTGEYALPRPPLVLECTFDGVPVVVINNHYKCCGDNVIEVDEYRDEERRRLVANQLLKEYCEVVYPDEKVVVVGDMNDELTDGPAGNVFADFLDSPDWRFVDLPIAQDATAQWSYPGWPSHLDHVLVNENVIDDAEAAGSEIRVLPLYEYLGSFNRYDTNISDHLPVLFRFVPTPVDPGDPEDPENPFDGMALGGDAAFDVVTWNLQHFPKADAATVEYVARAVEAMQPDVVALQEIESGAQFVALAGKLDGYAGLRAESAAYDVNLAYLVRTATVSIDDSYEILVGDDALPRAPFVLECTFDGKPFVVIDNHFKCCGDGTVDESYAWDEEWRRLRSSRLLIDYVAAEYPDDRVIVLGDLNDELDDPAADNVFVDFLEDGTNWRFLDLEIALDGNALWSYPSWPSHLDHIAVTNELFAAADAAGAEIRVVPLHEALDGGWSSYDGLISDHLPVAWSFSP